MRGRGGRVFHLLPQMSSLVGGRGIRELTRGRKCRHILKTIESSIRGLEGRVSRKVGGKVDRRRTGRVVRGFLCRVRSDSGGSRIGRLLRRRRGGRVRPICGKAKMVLRAKLKHTALDRRVTRGLGTITRGCSDLRCSLRAKGHKGEAKCTRRLLYRVAKTRTTVIIGGGTKTMLLTLDTLAGNKRIVISEKRLIRVNKGFHVPRILRLDNTVLGRIKAAGHAEVRSCGTTIDRGAGTFLGIRADGCEVINFARSMDTRRLYRLDGNLVRYARRLSPRVFRGRARQDEVPIVRSLNDNMLVGLRRCNLSGRPAMRRRMGTNTSIIYFDKSGLFNKTRTKILIKGGECVSRVHGRPLLQTLQTSGFALATVRRILGYCLSRGRTIRGVPALEVLAEPTRRVGRGTEIYTSE